MANDDDLSHHGVLLLTDVVDSTQVSQRLGDRASAELWAAHDRVARDLLPRHGGREIDKTDGMLLLFGQVAQALAYAQAYHQALAGLPVPLTARAGLHLGPLILRENSPADVARGAKPLEVDGMAKPTAARVMALAQAGQTLLSDGAAAALVEGLPPGWALASQGFWLFKGLAEPMEIFQALVPGQAAVPLAGFDKGFQMVRSGERWLPVADIPHNLPAIRTSFVGRETELANLRQMLCDMPLVTVVGMGGLGKTRLIQQVAREALPQFPDGVRWADLSGLTHASLVPAAVARALEVDEEPGRPLLDTLCAYVRSRRLLLLVDNCEHLVEAVGDLLHALLEQAAGLRVLASSREWLDLPGEQVYPILPLAVPDAAGDAQALHASAVARLFADRARSHQPDFRLEGQPPQALAELLSRLEGIPLAVELAAARLRSMNLPELLAALQDRFQTLSGGSRVLQRRQQTLRALVDWSYQLLSEPERALLQLLAVFRGGCDAEDVQAVGLAPPHEAAELPALLRALASKSLLTLDEQVAAGQPRQRFRLLETIREFGHEQLVLSGAEAAAQARHALHFFELAKAVRRGLQGAEQARHSQRMDLEVGNVRAAFEAALARRVDPFVAVKIAVAMQSYWGLRGAFNEGREAVRAALALPEVTAAPMAQAHALYVGAALATGQADHVEARRQLQACLALRRAMGQVVEIAATLSTLALAHSQAGDAAAAVACETEALGMFQTLGDAQGQAIGHIHLASFALAQGDARTARDHLDSGLALAQALGHEELQSECALMRADLEWQGGDAAACQAWLAQAQHSASRSANRRALATALWYRSRLAAQQGKLREACLGWVEALRAFRGFDMRAEWQACAEDGWLSATASGQGLGLEGLCLGAALAAQRQRWALPPALHQRARWQTGWQTLLAAWPAAQVQHQVARGRALDFAGLAVAFEAALKDRPAT